ncbi:hypothetical protein QE152_g6039 [Popillia japonica]|uniref:Reverse transcriptase domain-containing protein n=1 Tax=Popillia japonica TaxID=7064 RepID=A0AAW1MJB7_POPJA
MRLTPSPEKKSSIELDRRGMSQYLKNTITSYMEDSSLRIEKDLPMDVTTGVPQGSVLWPTLWNVVYDGVLRIQMPEGVWTVAYTNIWQL